MENYDWSLGLRFGELAVSFSWREYLTPKGDSQGYWGFVLSAEDSESSTEEQRFSPKEYWLKDAVIEAASNFRRAELRREIPTNTLEWVTSSELKKAKILELFERAEAGEYLGQRSGNRNLYVQDLAGIFDADFGHIRDLVDELVEEGRIGLSGMILISAESYEDGFRYWREQTGHRRLFVGDWGGWACHACGKTGDELDDPKSFECVGADQTEEASE